MSETCVYKEQSRHLGAEDSAVFSAPHKQEFQLEANTHRGSLYIYCCCAEVLMCVCMFYVLGGEGCVCVY